MGEPSAPEFLKVKNDYSERIYFNIRTRTMRQILPVLILICSIPYALSCARGRLKNPVNRGSVIERMVGNNIQLSSYSASGDDAVKTCDQLNCNLDSSCCWTNQVPPQDELNWVKASGTTDPVKMQKSFGTTSAPDGSFLITASDTAGASSQTAQLYSCPVQCANGDINVKLRHWQSSGSSIDVCQSTSPTDAPTNCKTLSSASGQSDSVTVPGGQNTRIVIMAKGFQTASGTVAMIDDITVQCEPCPESTPPPTQGPTQAPPPPAPLPPCKEINCNFEQGTPCSYTTASAGGNANKNWGVQSAPYENLLTGVKKNDEGSKFAASYLKKAGEKSVLVTNANFDNSYVVKFDYYKAVEGVDLRVCCDSEGNCPFDTTTDVQVSHYRQWRQATAQCSPGTKKVLFVSENKKGDSEGAVGLDNIQLLQSTGQAGSGQPACS